MAVITTEFDTKTKALTVKRDGTEMANVIGASFYLYSMDEDEDDRDKKKFECRVQMGSRNKDENLREYMTLVASESAEGRELVHAGYGPAKDMPEFVEGPAQSQVARDVAACFSRK